MPPDRRSSRHRPPDRVTMGDVRAQGCRDLLVYCTSGWCHHSAKLSGDFLPDETALLDLDPCMVCTACGLIGADVRPDYSPHTGAPGMGGAHRR